ncbi:MAG: hypothetical protein O3B47_02620, partial [bacterium]|nr:hypothetical protein [bacterium]
IDVLDIGDYEGSGTPDTKVEEKIDAKDISELGLDDKLVEALKATNLTQVEQMKGLSAKDLSEIDGIDEEGAKAIEAAVKKAK